MQIKGNILKISESTDQPGKCGNPAGWESIAGMVARENRITSEKWFASSESNVFRLPIAEVHS
jgi:hypothetical protein